MVSNLSYYLFLSILVVYYYNFLCVESPWPKKRPSRSGQTTARCGGGTKGHRRSLEFPDIPEAKDTRVLLEAPSSPLLQDQYRRYAADAHRDMAPEDFQELLAAMGPPPQVPQPWGPPLR